MLDGITHHPCCDNTETPTKAPTTPPTFWHGAGTTVAPTFEPSMGKSSRMIYAAGDCSGVDATSLGQGLSRSQCADACGAQAGCRFFRFGVLDGACATQDMATSECAGGFAQNGYDVNELFADYFLVHADGDCDQPEDTDLGTATGLDDCAAKCRAVGGCQFFKHRSSDNSCWRDAATTAACTPGFNSNDYALYELYKSFWLVHSGGDCTRSGDVDLGEASSVDACAVKCEADVDCRFFAYRADAAECWRDNALTATCAEGWRDAPAYNTYEVETPTMAPTRSPTIPTANPSLAPTVDYCPAGSFFPEDGCCTPGTALPVDEACGRVSDGAHPGAAASPYSEGGAGCGGPGREKGRRRRPTLQKILR